MIRLWKPIANMTNEKNFLNLQVVVFLVLPVLYLVYLQMTNMVTGVGIKGIYAQNPLEGLNLLMNASNVYSAYVIYHYRKNQYIKGNFLAYIVVGIAQIFMMNAVGILMMLYSICYFTGLSGIKKCFAEYPWGKNYKIIFSAGLVFVISLILLAVRIKSIII